MACLSDSDVYASSRPVEPIRMKRSSRSRDASRVRVDEGDG